MKKLILLIIWIVFIWWASTYATVCDFSWYKKQDNAIYWVTQCDNDHLNIIPFADYSSFEFDENNINQARDYNYLYNQKYVVWKSDETDFVELNKYIFTDRKNIFIKSQELYLYITKYKFDTKIFTIYETNTGWRYLLVVKDKVFNINISWNYISYSYWLHQINNIFDTSSIKQVSDFIFTDGKYFYSTFLENQSTIWMDFWVNIPTADFFSSQNKQFFEIKKMWDRLVTMNYSEKSLENMKLIYDKLNLTKNPYTWEDQTHKYKEFFIKKELLLYYLWQIVNK